MANLFLALGESCETSAHINLARFLLSSHWTSFGMGCLAIPQYTWEARVVLTVVRLKAKRAQESPLLLIPVEGR